MHSNQVSFQQYLQETSTTPTKNSEDENLMAEFFVDPSTTGQLQGVVVGAGQDFAGPADAPGTPCDQQEEPPFQPGMFYNGQDPYKAVSNVENPAGQSFSCAPSQRSDAVAGGPIRQHSRCSKAKPNSYKYPSSTLNTAALYLPLVSDDGEEMLTKNICQRMIYELNSRGISQNVFAEKVLARNRSRFSQMLNKPADFSVLTARGMIVYQKVITWINLSEEEKQLVLDGKLVICEPGAEPDVKQEAKPEVEPEPEQPNKVGNTKASFSPDQISMLQDSYAKNFYPSRRDKDALAKQLDLPKKSIDLWFNNARRRSKCAERKEEIQQ